MHVRMRRRQFVDTIIWSFFHGWAVYATFDDEYIQRYMQQVK